jgi:2-polyprenyl-3-methyl-5-hydroxy-6-metoxy-1,4-benzoquinol methylase
VEGIDVSAGAIEFARSHYADANTSFRVGDWSEALRGSNYSFVVAFEFLEHIAEQEQFIEQAARSLVDGGQFFVSTPNVAASRGKNPHHLRELSLKEFEGLLGRHFREVRTVGQYIKPEFYIRQKELLDYVDSLSLPLPSILQRCFRRRSLFLRGKLENTFAGLQLEDILFSRGETARTLMFVARCRP